MKEYTVEVPAILKLTISVKAENEEEAKTKALQAPIVSEMRLESSGYDDYDIHDYTCIDYEWEVHTKIVQGNVYYGSINEIRIIDEEEIDGNSE